MRRLSRLGSEYYLIYSICPGAFVANRRQHVANAAP